MRNNCCPLLSPSPIAGLDGPVTGVIERASSLSKGKRRRQQPFLTAELTASNSNSDRPKWPGCRAAKVSLDTPLQSSPTPQPSTSLSSCLKPGLTGLFSTALGRWSGVVADDDAGSVGEGGSDDKASSSPARKTLARASRLIIGSLAPNVFRQVQTLDTPRQIWAKLHADTPLSFKAAFRAVTGSAIPPAADLKAMAATLKSLNEPVSPRMLIDRVMSPLPASYALTVSMVRAILNTDPAAISVAAVRDVLTEAATAQASPAREGDILRSGDPQRSRVVFARVPRVGGRSDAEAMAAGVFFVA
ncbi:hypothetical protein BDK51DRAFT_41609 [Blyttiomyces helicus]|uniref:Uncharacterized protein n=1 Tax=Blyttiomyces helicus TaxID=388810 RepID=A0A4P9VY23_9FUNG|nr:hypothetical protein BDK51DRAFT_41609 [Blyttiomyces helicus]|eukprot:RKO83633.1 hypothetical protein BDK51DRAFT_41609 [Blyttiomyces helicus]